MFTLEWDSQKKQSFQSKKKIIIFNFCRNFAWSTRLLRAGMLSVDIGCWLEVVCLAFSKKTPWWIRISTYEMISLNMWKHQLSINQWLIDYLHSAIRLTFLDLPEVKSDTTKVFSTLKTRNPSQVSNLFGRETSSQTLIGIFCPEAFLMTAILASLVGCFLGFVYYACLRIQAEKYNGAPRKTFTKNGWSNDAKQKKIRKIVSHPWFFGTDYIPKVEKSFRGFFICRTKKGDMIAVMTPSFSPASRSPLKFDATVGDGVGNLAAFQNPRVSKFSK